MSEPRYYPARLSRRRALGLFGATAALLGNGAARGAEARSGSTRCVLTPEEIVGPYPLFRNVTDVATLTRRDITEGSDGVPLQLLLTVVDVNDGCTPIADALVYVWHCDKDGVYSGYGRRAAQATFCRGVQQTDSGGLARFMTIYPGWYAGRMTHIHFRVYLGRSLQATSQLGFPEEVTRTVYRSPLYAARGQNTAVRSFGDDGVFADGHQYQICTMSEHAAGGGYSAALTVGVAL